MSLDSHATELMKKIISEKLGIEAHKVFETVTELDLGFDSIKEFIDTKMKEVRSED